MKLYMKKKFPLDKVLRGIFINILKGVDLCLLYNIVLTTIMNVIQCN